MAIITIGSSKGGVGKSTLTVNLGTIRKLAGDDVLLMDGDPQQSVSDWGAVRDSKNVEPSVPVSQMVGQGFAKSVKQTATRYGTTFIDVPGNEAIELRSAMQISNLVVIPLKPSNFDAWVFGKQVELLEAARINNPSLKALVVFNSLSTNPNVRNLEIQDVRAFLSSYAGFDIATSFLCERSIFKRSIADGKGIMEVNDRTNSAEKGRVELMGVYEEIFEYLDQGVAEADVYSESVESASNAIFHSLG